MLSPVIYFNVIMGIIGSLQTFTQAFVMTGAEGRPARSTLFYALYLFTTAFTNCAWVTRAPWLGSCSSSSCPDRARHQVVRKADALWALSRSTGGR